MKFYYVERASFRARSRRRDPTMDSEKARLRRAWTKCSWKGAKCLRKNGYARHVPGGATMSFVQSRPSFPMARSSAPRRSTTPARKPARDIAARRAPHRGVRCTLTTGCCTRSSVPANVARANGSVSAGIRRSTRLAPRCSSLARSTAMTPSRFGTSQPRFRRRRDSTRCWATGCVACGAAPTRSTPTVSITARITRLTSTWATSTST